MKFWKKKDKKPYPRSFAKRLTWRIMIMMFVVMGIISYIIFQTVLASITAGAKFAVPQILGNNTENIAGKLSEVSVAAINTAPEIEARIDQPDAMYDIMERMVELNPHIRSCGISFVDSYYPQKGRWFCPYAIRRDSATIERQTLGDKFKDYLSAEWFTETITRNESHWSKPFFAGDSTKIPLTAYLVPIHDKQGKAIAVLGVDFQLDELSPIVVKKDWSKDDSTVWSAEYEAYAFAIDSSGNYLLHPDRKRIIKDNFLTRAKATPQTMDNKIAREMMAGESKSHHSIMNKDLYIDGERVCIFYAPIKQTAWSYAYVVPALFVEIIGYLFGGILLLFILIGLIIVFFAGRRGIKKSTKPLRLLAASADEVAKGNFNTQLPVMKSRDEIHQLRDSFENMQHSLTKYIDELRTTTAQKASMESELKIAHDIQMSMLPKTFPPYPERTDIDIYGTLTPAKGVGGDLFDFYIREEKLFFCIGDVSGKGIPASLYMAVTRSLFRNVSAHVSEPDKIVIALNNAQAEGNDTNMFVTIFVGVLDLQTGILSYCNAGHDAPLLVGRDVGELPCDSNLPIGVIANFKFTQQQTRIDSGTTIFLFTDGLNEAENMSHDQFGDMRIWKICQKQLAGQSHQPQKLIEKMTDEVHHFVGDAEQSDDLTMLAIQYKR